MTTNVETTEQPTTKSAYNGQEKRKRGEGGEAFREAIGKDKILTETQREVVLERKEQGTFQPRTQQKLRNALGGDGNIFSDEQRKNVLGALKEAVMKFFKAGVSRAVEDEAPQRKSFASKILGERKTKETSRKIGE